MIMTISASQGPIVVADILPRFAGCGAACEAAATDAFCLIV
jgi:hypothetical protein